ncbi:rio1-domain-containing protein [Phaffia rhodozyma]|uniref:non-specific serine/threonine protein kinase n=1 Tax=Phaffia rhodozyma TaxID=264483 RepID=A0A0F7SKM6_PHARH|nr:rio1-domain-containing protein [Phaffia rhodozyma]
MSLVDGYALRQVAEHPNPGRLYSQLMSLLVRFARAGLIHGDFNEFNILIRDEDGEPVVIDFPQLVSTNHKDAEWYFNRDVACIRTFFRRRFNYESKIYPRFRKALSDDSVESFTLDVEVAASGFGKNEAAKLDGYMAELKGEEGSEEEDSDSEEEEEEEDEDEDEEEEEEDGKETKEEEIERLMREADEEDSEQAPALVSNLADTLSSTTLSTTTAATATFDPETESGSEAEEESGSETDQPRTQTRKTHPHAPPPKLDDVRSTVQSDLNRDRARAQAKHHAKAAPGKLGNKKGTKKRNEGKSRLMKAEKSGANDGW